MSFALPGIALASMAKAQKKIDKTAPDYYTVFRPGEHGQAYQGLAESNPYKDVVYRESWIQKALAKLGFRTSKDAYLESMALQAQEYDNQIKQKEYNEAYDSPLAQAMREQQAGLNPDLTGNISAGESQAPVDDGNPPVAPVADDLQVVQNFATGVLSAVETAFGLFGNMQSIRSMQLENNNKSMQLVKDAWSMIIPDVYEHRNNSGDLTFDINNYYNKLKTHFGSMMSKRQFKNFVGRVNAFADSAEGWDMLYSTQKKKAFDRKSFFQEISDPEYYSEWDDIMSDIANRLANLANTTAEAHSKNMKYSEENVVPKANENAKRYQEAYNPEVAARLASNPDDLTIKANAVDASDYARILRSSFKDILSDLDRRSKNGSNVAPFVKAVVSALLLGQISIPGL